MTWDFILAEGAAALTSLAMSYYNSHSQWNASEPSQWYPADPSSVNYRPITDVGPGYYQPQNQSYNAQPNYDESQLHGGSQGAIEEILPFAESHSRNDADLGVPESARTE